MTQKRNSPKSLPDRCAESQYTPCTGREKEIEHTKLPNKNGEVGNLAKLEIRSGMKALQLLYLKECSRVPASIFGLQLFEFPCLKKQRKWGRDNTMGKEICVQINYNKT
tara:strand:+ start:6864 stop:7190 length:327 start_codon:yes stop_codon:yes gene_type:complete